jgi:tetratricopeptide (TPR) repeat protein
MAPEQIRGESVDAHSDQFAFCVAMWEAFAGQRPFAGDTVESLFDRVKRGEIREPPPGRMPKWVEVTLRRGLASDAAHRHVSMDALLHALERGATRGRWIRSAVGAGIAALAAIAVWGGVEVSQRWVRAGAIASCEAEGAAIESVWNADTRTQLREALLGTGLSYAATTADKATPWLDAQAEAWRRARTDACVQAEVDGAWDEDTLDRSLWCLDLQRMQLEALITRLVRVEAGAMEHAVEAAARPANVAACVDTRLNERFPPPPPARRDEARDVAAMLARADVLARSGGLDEALTTARSAREQAESLEWPPLWADARAEEASILDERGDYVEAARAFSEAYFAAAGASAWHISALSASRLAFIFGARLSRREEGLSWAAHAEMAATHAEDPEGLLEADRLGHLAALHTLAGEYVDARRLAERALAIEENALGPDHPGIIIHLNHLTNVLLEAGEYAEAEKLGERAAATAENALGPEHPRTMASLLNLANVLQATGQYERARGLFERAVATYERALGPVHPDFGRGLVGLGNAHFVIGDYKHARAAFERALAGSSTSTRSRGRCSSARLRYASVCSDPITPTSPRAWPASRRSTSPRRTPREHGNCMRERSRFASAPWAWITPTSRASSSISPPRTSTRRTSPRRGHSSSEAWPRSSAQTAPSIPASRTS